MKTFKDIARFEMLNEEMFVRARNFLFEEASKIKSTHAGEVGNPIIKVVHGMQIEIDELRIKLDIKYKESEHYKSRYEELISTIDRVKGLKR